MADNDEGECPNQEEVELRYKIASMEVILKEVESALGDFAKGSHLGSRVKQLKEARDYLVTDRQKLVTQVDILQDTIAKAFRR